MPAPAIPFGTRFTSRGTTRIYFLTAVASYTTAVTRTELNAGVDLTTQIMDSSGWSVKSNQIDTPDASTRFTSKIPGPIDAVDSSLTMYASKNGVDARATFSSGSSTVPPTAGYVVILYGGDVASNKMDVWPVTVSSVSKNIELGGDKADTLVISFSPTGEPAQNLTTPA
jgi:hypothetical protein